MPAHDGSDPYAPAAIAARVGEACAARARQPLVVQFVLGTLGGAFIGLGAMFAALVLADTALGLAAARLAAGVAFSLGLLMVVVTGAGLFAADNLLVMAWADGRLPARAVLRDWAVVGVANFVGAAGVAIAVWLSGHGSLGDGAVAASVLSIADAKCRLGVREAFFGGLLGNVLICVALWMALAARGVADRFVAVCLPAAALVAAGFEHAVANAYLIPLGILLKSQALDGAAYDAIGWVGLARNLVPVVAGNLVGGALLVAGVYALADIRDDPRG